MLERMLLMSFFPKREADLKYLAKSEIEALEQSIEENKSLTFGQLMRKSHDEALGRSKPSH